MSKFTKEMVDDYADKLLIGLTPEENASVLAEFEVIDETINTINKIPGIEKVEPMNHCLDDFKCELRDDEPTESCPLEDILRNCDLTDGREIEVPKVVGE